MDNCTHVNCTVVFDGFEFDVRVFVYMYALRTSAPGRSPTDTQNCTIFHRFCLRVPQKNYNIGRGRSHKQRC